MARRYGKKLSASWRRKYEAARGRPGQGKAAKTRRRAAAGGKSG